MRIPIFWLFLAGFSPALSAADDIDFRGHVTQILGDGVSRQRLYFSAGEVKYALSLDDYVSSTVSGAGTKFTFKNVKSGEVEIRPSPMTPVLPFAGEDVEKYRKLALTLVPEGGAEPEITEGVADPLNVNGWKSYRVSFSYPFFGVIIRKSVTFLTFENGQQALIESSAKEAEFAGLMSRADYLIRTWHVLNDKPVRP